MSAPAGFLAALRANAARFALSEGASFDAGHEWTRCMERGISVLTPESAGYPPLLSPIPDFPRVLYLKGKLPDIPALAIVGSRRPTPYGRRVARALAAEAARAGIVTVSGLARGIDAEVHGATLEAGGATVAVLGSGFDRLYPRENAGLADAIVSNGGALLSEAPLEAGPMPGNFPRRNRIICGLAYGTVVVEGDLKSGSLITAKAALEQGREVFAVPGPVDSPLSDGPHELLRNGARLLRRLEDALEELPMLRGSPKTRPAAPRAMECTTPEEEKILESIGSEARCLEELSLETGLAARLLAPILVELEVKNLLRAYPGQRYARR